MALADAGVVMVVERARGVAHLAMGVIAPAGEGGVGGDRAGVSAAGRERDELAARDPVELARRVVPPTGERAAGADRAAMCPAGGDGGGRQLGRGAGGERQRDEERAR